MKISLNQICFFATIIIIAIFFGTILFYSVNIPIWDDYDAVLGFMNKFTEPGSNKLDLLFSQHNEHRIVYDRLVAIITTKIFGEVNFKILIIIGNLSLLGILLIFLDMFPKKNKYVFLLPVVLLLFSYLYHETVYWGMASLANIGVIFFSIASIYLLTKEMYFFSILFSILATFTSGQGLLIFPLGILTLVFKKKYKRLFIWIPATLAIFFIYFHRYVKPGYHPSIIDALLNPIHSMAYSLSFLGSGLGNIFQQVFVPKELAIISAVIGLGILFFLTYLVIKKYYKTNIANCSVILFVLGACFLATLSRSGFGIAQALSSRYSLISIILLICVYVSLVDLKIILVDRTLFCLILCLIVFNAVSFNIIHEEKSIKKIDLIRGMYLWNLNISPTDKSKDYLNFPEQKKAENILIESLNKKIYRYNMNLTSSELEKIISMPQKMRINKTNQTIKYGFDIYSNKSLISVYDGWAFINNQNTKNQKVYLILTSKNKTYKFNTFSNIRPDVSQYFNNSKLDYSGFSAIILPKNTLPQGKYSVGIYIMNGKITAFQDTPKTILVK